MRIYARQGLLDWTAKGKARIAQNVRNLLNTFQYEVAYHRTMGLSDQIIDQPLPWATQQLEIQARALIVRYEPRAKIREIFCAVNQAGDLEIEVELDD